MKPSQVSRSIIKFIYRTFVLVVLPLVLFPGLAAPSSEPARFFRSGDGQIHIRNEKDGREANVNLIDPRGLLNGKALKEIDAVFGFPDSPKGEHVSLRLLFLLDYFSDNVAPGKKIHLVSGYRSPSYNEKLKKSGGNVARTSAHIDGMALDFFIEGVDGKALWEAIRKENCCGVGHYGGRVVHLDSGKPRFWEATTSKVDTKESEFNRRIYLSTEYDRYKRGEVVRFFLTSVSDFKFGIQNVATLINERDGTNRQTGLSVQSQPEESCLSMNTRSATRFVYSTLPADLEPGRYRIRFDFCNRPFAQMPSVVISNEIEIVQD